jgi:uncharacterized membrane protein
MLYEIILIILSLGGLYIANKIRVEKKKGRKMICPLNGNCDQILSSDFSKIIGIPLEITGLGYYLIVIIINLLFIFLPSLKFSLLDIILYGMTLFGFLFSVYLIAIQAFHLKNWCVWCLYSALFSILIFLAATLNFKINFDSLIQVMTIHSWFFVLTNIVAYALGTSVAIVIEILTLRFLKDFKINYKEKITLMYLWQILWSVIFLVIISSFAILIFNFDLFQSSTIFKLKTIIMGIIILLSIIMIIYVLPKLDKSKISCNVMNVFALSWFRNIAIILSTIILLSWVTNVFINQIFNSHNSLSGNLISYFITVISVSILILLFFQVADHKMLDKKKEKRDNKINGQI